MLTIKYGRTQRIIFLALHDVFIFNLQRIQSIEPHPHPRAIYEERTQLKTMEVD